MIIHETKPDEGEKTLEEATVSYRVTGAMTAINEATRMDVSALHIVKILKILKTINPHLFSEVVHKAVTYAGGWQLSDNFIVIIIVLTVPPSSRT